MTKLTRQFQPAPGKPGALAARFTVAVTLTPDHGPHDIWRGRDAQGHAIKVGSWTTQRWSICVHGRMSGLAYALDAAMALGEAYASDSTRGRLHALTPERARQYLGEVAANSAALMAAFPYLPEEAAALAASNARYASILEGADEREFMRLIGG